MDNLKQVLYTFGQIFLANTYLTGSQLYWTSVKVCIVREFVCSFANGQGKINEAREKVFPSVPLQLAVTNEQASAVP